MAPIPPELLPLNPSPGPTPLPAPSGPLKPSLAKVPTLMQLDISSNRLSGDLSGFAAEVERQVGGTALAGWLVGSLAAGGVFLWCRVTLKLSLLRQLSPALSCSVCSFDALA